MSITRSFDCWKLGTILGLAMTVIAFAATTIVSPFSAPQYLAYQLESPEGKVDTILAAGVSFEEVMRVDQIDFGLIGSYTLFLLSAGMLLRRNAPMRERAIWTVAAVLPGIVDVFENMTSIVFLASPENAAWGARSTWLVKIKWALLAIAVVWLVFSWLMSRRARLIRTP